MNFVKNENFKVKNGNKNYVLFDGILKSEHNSYLHILFNDETELKCSLVHRFIVNDKEIKAIDLKEEMNLGGKEIFHIEYKEEKIELFDLVAVEETNTYYHNDTLISHNCAEFLGSTNTLIDPNVLRRLTFVNPESTHYEGSLSIYEEPREKGIYFCVVDTSRGSGIDASAFLVFDVSEVPYKVVAAYKNNIIDPLLYPEVIYSVAKSYNDAFALIEINDNGQQIADILHFDLEYENIVFTSVKGRAGQVIGGGFSSTVQRGVRTTKQVKRIGCSNAKTMIEKDKIILNDYNLVNELSTFIQKGTSYEADAGSHDDLIMCVVLFAWATNQTFFKELTETDFRKKLLEDREKMIVDDVLPFGFIDDGGNPEVETTINTPVGGGFWNSFDNDNKWQGDW